MRSQNPRYGWVPDVPDRRDPFVFGFTVYESFETETVAAIGKARCLPMARAS